MRVYLWMHQKSGQIIHTRDKKEINQYLKARKWVQVGIWS